MEHPFFPTTTTRAEALQWLSIAEKLLSSRDLDGSKSFATRARDSDPTLSHAELIIAVADTLLASERRIGNNQPDWYGVLRLTPQQGNNSQLVSSQYRNLVPLLSPQSNKYPFADHAFQLIMQAYAVLSDPVRKAMYDKELAFYLQLQQHQPDPFTSAFPTMQQNFNFFWGNAAASSVAQPQVHVGGSSSSGQSHFLQAQQVNAGQLPQVEPVNRWSTREPQNFVSFTSSSNSVFGSGPGSGSGPGPSVSHKPVNKIVQESFPGFPGGNMAPAAEPNHDSLNNDKQKQPFENYSTANVENGHDVNVSENVGDMSNDEANVDGVEVVGEEEEERVYEPTVEPEIDDGGMSFWTACPYCFYMYEYLNMYIDCSMRCQNCKSAFQAVVIPSPPPIVDGQEVHFVCWGYFPLGFSVKDFDKNMHASSAWTPFSSMFTSPPSGSVKNASRNASGQKRSTPRVYVDEDDDYVELSDSEEFDDDDWNKDSEKKKKAKTFKGKGSSIGTPNNTLKKVLDGVVSSNRVEMPNNTSEPTEKEVMANARKQPGRVAKNFGKLDLNVEFSNETEEPASRVNQVLGPGSGDEDNIEGNGFFEGLDDFLSSLPILNGVGGDDKVVKVA